MEDCELHVSFHKLMNEEFSNFWTLLISLRYDFSKPAREAFITSPILFINKI